MVKIKLYNTASRKKEEFIPIEKGKVGIYSCGPTVYWNQHVGNLYAYLFADVLVRTLKYVGYEVLHVMNLTDVGHLTSNANEGEDKMEVGSRREGVSVWDLAKKYEKQFFESEKLLNIVRPNIVCRATDYIAEQIELVQKIEKNGFTYEIGDGIYFDTSKFPGYADFARLDLSKIRDTDRSDISKEKKNLSDFVLWKFSPKNGPKRQMEWESPWGVGFPGWAIECTAMSIKHLGQNFDIHTGGIDHIPVHHTNEIAQGYGAFGKQTANYWLHNAWVTGKRGRKMSKSKGEIFTAQELVELNINPLVYRYLFLTTHYRKGLEFSLDSLKATVKPYIKLSSFMNDWSDGGKIEESYRKRFVDLVSDDLAMPETLALIWKLVKDNNISDADKKATVLDFDKVLGLDLGKKIEVEDVPDDIIKMAEDRKTAKGEKNWQVSDKLRQTIETRGFIIEDLPNNSYRIVVKR